MTTFKRAGKAYHVQKQGQGIAKIEKIGTDWVLTYATGRIERFETLDEAKDTALKI